MKAAEQDRELALTRANTLRELAEVQAETERVVAQARAQSRRERLQSVMEMYATVQANKRARTSMDDDDSTSEGPPVPL